jgi:ATP-dependent HslUV protease ATP-binding subunit HslU
VKEVGVRDLTPREIVAELDRYIVGQGAAKKAVAVALRNRMRRMRLPEAVQEEIAPKNILMIGPTGVGKTEIARRLAKLVNAPFVKVEATKYTEVGYVGRDVESMIRDLVEAAIQTEKQARTRGLEEKARAHAEERLLEVLLPGRKRRGPRSPFEALMGGGSTPSPEEQRADEEFLNNERSAIKQKLEAGELEERVIEVEVDAHQSSMSDLLSGAGMEEMGIDMQEMLGGLLPKQKKRRKVTVTQARDLFFAEELDKLVDMDEVSVAAIKRAEQSGIVFIDEIDKIASTGNYGSGPDVSREGVQRDILPIVEGTTVKTKYGFVHTDHILFVAAGAFHVSKPSDLIPELQGRFPIRVELESLTREDLERILTEPGNALLRQYEQLLAVEGIKLSFTSDAIAEIANISYDINTTSENIGARRLHTVVEKVLEDVAFTAGDPDSPDEVVIDQSYVRSKLRDIVLDRDLRRFIL